MKMTQKIMMDIKHLTDTKVSQIEAKTYFSVKNQLQFLILISN